MTQSDRSLISSKENLMEVMLSAIFIPYIYLTFGQWDWITFPTALKRAHAQSACWTLIAVAWGTFALVCASEGLYGYTLVWAWAGVHSYYSAHTSATCIAQ